MSLYALPKSAIQTWIASLSRQYHVIGPVAFRDTFIFDTLDDPTRLAFDYTKTILPPKKYLLPVNETLFQFKIDDGSQITTIGDHPPTVLFGIHTCDLHAVHLVDRFFEQGFQDQPYLRRRAATTIVSIECLQPCSQHSFCKSMGTYSVPDAFDLHLTDIGEHFVCEIGSDAGAEIFDHCAASNPIGQHEHRAYNQTLGEKWSRFPHKLEPDLTNLPSLMALSYENELWQELGERCLSCGTCNLVCPTCYCFNVIDEVDLDLKTGERYRTWDSCQLDGFASVAGGHNFRSKRASRLRHRMMRKGKFQYEALGLVGCVGCGRCVQSCLANISPLDVFNELHRRQLSPASCNREVSQ